MKKLHLYAAVTVLLVGSTATVTAQDSPAVQAMRDCNARPESKDLRGDARKNFMAKCLAENSPPAYAATANVPVIHPSNPVQALLGDGGLASFTVTTGVLAQEAGNIESYTQQSANLRELGIRADHDVETAVHFAHGRQDLVHAIKDYYSALSALIAGGIPTSRLQKIGSDRLKTELEAKEKTLTLEAKLAGVKVR